MRPHLAVHLEGRWTRPQLRALRHAGWITFDAYQHAVEVTTHSDSCRWFVLSPIWTRSGEDLRGH